MNSCSFRFSRAVAEIDVGALAHNFRAVSAGGGRTIAVVKANAYGHGISLVVPALLAAGCDFFAVASVDEALAVRALAPRADILILGYTPVTAAPLLAHERLTQAVFSAPYAAALASAARTPVPVHIKIDGGMCRLGISPQDRDALSFVLQAQNLTVRGLFTHLPSVLSDPVGTSTSLADFLALRRSLPQLFAHAAATPALSLPDARLDGVRVGLALYGYAPQDTFALRRAMRVLAPIIQIRTVAKGTPVGYDGAFLTARDSCIGTLPIGYADGLRRHDEGSQVLLRCENTAYFAPIIGHICMDQCMIDLSDIPAREGDTVCVLSDFTAAAARRSTIVYEALTTLSARVVRQQKGALF